MNRSIATLATAAGLAAAIAAGTALADGASAAQSAAPSGLGWSAVIHHQTSRWDNKGTLKMVGPTGSTITIGQVSDDAAIHDVSLDGARAITAFSTNDQTRFAFWNTKSRTATFLRLGGDWGASYISGGGILTVDPLRGLAYKRDAAGKALTRFSMPGNASDSWVNPEGTHWVVSYGTKMVVRSATTGAVQRTIASPTGKRCYVDSQDTAGALLARCTVTDELGGDRMFKINYTGAASSTPVAPLGYGANSTTPRLGTYVTGAGYTNVEAVTAATHKRLPTSRVGNVIGGYSDQAWVVSGGSITSDADALYRMNAKTGAWTALSGGPKGGIVTDAQVIDGHN